MANSYQLVAWTDKGQVKMIPEEAAAFLDKELEKIESLHDQIRYGTHYETQDILRVSCAYEKLGLLLSSVGMFDEAFRQLLQAAYCCRWCSEYNWLGDPDDAPSWPLRGRFCALYIQCRELAEKHPTLRFEWEKSGLEIIRGVQPPRAC